MKPIRSKKLFTLLEVMIGIALLAIAAGALFWRIDRMVERKRFDSDINRFRSILVSTRSLAINTKMDFRFELKNQKARWNLRLICREDPDLVYALPCFSNVNLFFDSAPLQEFAVDFYSSGFVGPKGLLTLSHKSQTSDFKFPEFFYRHEGSLLAPLHPSELETEKK